MELIIIFILAILNGVLAMSELAVVSARRARLQAHIEDGNESAKIALELAESPNRFLSTVQIGISLIGVLAGAFGGATLADDVGAIIENIDTLAPYSDALGFTMIVVFTTYLSLVFGELVPKRLAIYAPERIAMLVAPPMQLLSRLAYPLVLLLSVSTEFVLRILNIRDTDEPTVTEEEVAMMLREGTKDGVFDLHERDMIAGVFRLDDLRVSALMTPRTEMMWLDVSMTGDEIMAIFAREEHTRYPVIDGSPDAIVGLVKTRHILKKIIAGESINLKDMVQTPFYIPEGATASVALARMRRDREKLGFVVGEHGGVEGIISIHDLVEAVIGDLDEPEAIQRQDGSWLIDGLMPVAEFKATFNIREDLPGETEGLYQTVAGFFMYQHGENEGDLPHASDQFDWDIFRFEVLDMDGKRIDKLLVRLINADTDTNET